MSHSGCIRFAFAGLLAAGVFIFGGCLVTKFTLIPPDQAKVNPAYVGDWDALSMNGSRAKIIIRNIDEKLYYVEIDEKDNEPERYVGFVADINGGATFAHLRRLRDDGKIDDEWMLMRISLPENFRMVLDQLSDDFFKNMAIGSPQQLRQVLEQNLNNQEMYSKDERIVATRVEKKG